MCSAMEEGEKLLRTETGRAGLWKALGEMKDDAKKAHLRARLLAADAEDQTSEQQSPPPLSSQPLVSVEDEISHTSPPGTAEDETPTDPGQQQAPTPPPDTGEERTSQRPSAPRTVATEQSIATPAIAAPSIDTSAITTPAIAAPTIDTASIAAPIITTPATAKDDQSTSASRIGSAPPTAKEAQPHTSPPFAAGATTPIALATEPVNMTNANQTPPTLLMDTPTPAIELSALDEHSQPAQSPTKTALPSTTTGPPPATTTVCLNRILTLVRILTLTLFIFALALYLLLTLTPLTFCHFPHTNRSPTILPPPAHYPGSGLHADLASLRTGAHLVLASHATCPPSASAAFELDAWVGALDGLLLDPLDNTTTVDVADVVVQLLPPLRKAVERKYGLLEVFGSMMGWNGGVGWDRATTWSRGVRGLREGVLEVLARVVDARLR